MIRCLPASLAVLVGIVSVSQDLLRAASHTNVIIVYADDLGNGDLGVTAIHSSARRISIAWLPKAPG